MKIFSILFTGLIIVTINSHARDLVVDPSAGGDDSYATFASAALKAKPGDTIKLKPAAQPYRLSIGARALRGTEAQPIVIDGQGCTLLGTDPLEESLWESLGNGLFRNGSIAVQMKITENDLQRFFFVFDGKIQRMGRISKAARPAFLEPEKLQPGEWTYVPADKEFYVRIAAGSTLAEAKVEVPVRDSGVALAEGCENVVVRNFTARNFLNDGFNLHGGCRALLFENIAAYGCGDDGFTEHEDCQAKINGYRAGDNATGFCNVNRSVCEAQNVTLDHNAGYEIYLTDSSNLTLKNATIHTNAKRPLVLRASDRDPEPCRLIWADSLIASDSPHVIEIFPKSELIATKVIFLGLSWRVDGKAQIGHCTLAGSPPPAVDISATGIWIGEENTYGLSRIKAESQVWDGGPDFPWPNPQDSDKGSTWQSFDSSALEALQKPGN